MKVLPWTVCAMSLWGLSSVQSAEELPHHDPNGAFHANGWYHVFYQHNPYGNGWGNMHWGHARSRDNVTWERLPVGVWPSTEKGEDHCYSGCAVQDGDGNWQLWYTSVSKPREKDKDKGRLAWVFNGQVMLKPMDQDYIKWGKTTDDPINKPTLPGFAAPRGKGGATASRCHGC